MRIRLLVAAVAAILAAPMVRADDADAIRHAMMAIFDRPEAPLTIEPVTIQGDLAIAGWVQGDMGGRALLRKEDRDWQLSLCAGDALKEPDSLVQLGLTTEEAEALAAAVAAAEADVAPALVAKFSLFEGIVTMGEDGSHPPGHDQPAPSH